MPKDQVFIGVSVAILCALGLWQDRWFLTQTRKGQRLVRWFGDANAIWVLRALFLAGVVFGLLLACGIIHPLQW